MVHQPGDEHDETNNTEELATWSPPDEPPIQPTSDFPSAPAPPPPVGPPMPAEADDASPTPHKRRLPIFIGAAVLALVVLGGAAFAVARLWTSPSVNPAERLPNDVVFYLDVNLDPGRDQTSRLLEVLDKFEALDDATDIEGMLSDLLDQLDLDGVDPDDLSGWLGTRAAAAVWLDPGQRRLHRCARVRQPRRRCRAQRPGQHSRSQRRRVRLCRRR